VICANCQAENRPDRKFCLRCGQPLAASCPNCGASNEPEAAFCGECGTRLGAAASGAGFTGAAVSGASGPSAGPATAVGAVAPVGERRLVSVLFADLVGYTTIAERLDPDDARELLDRYFAASREIVQRYGGVVEKFIGDAVMAVWGAPTSHEDDAERAVRAALDLVAMVPRLAARGTSAGLQLRAGVLSGEAAVTIGADGQGMVAGDLVNTAARLQSVAEPGTVLVGEVTMRAASGAIAFDPVGEQALKGKTAPVPAWRPTAVVGKVGGAGRSDLIEPPFVGRDAEFSALKERLHATARDGRARLVSVMGVAGIGKSRLAWELEKYLDGLVETVYWHHGRSPAYGEGLAFWALGEMVRRRAGIAERDDTETTAAKLDASVAEWIADPEERRWVAPRLRTLLGLEEAASGSREETFAAWRRYFERIAERGTTVLVFEDLQWADDGLVDFIESLLEWSRGKPLLIVTLARPELTERRPTWGLGQREFTSLYLQPLPTAVMTDLVRGIAPGLPPDIATRIADQSEGIPLYAVELFRMLLDRGDLASGPDGFRVTGPISEIHAPHTLQALISARLDALPVEERRLLQDASVLGKTFSPDALAAVTGMSASSLEPVLRSLVRREFLSVDVDPRSPERGQYGFVGALVREVAYATLSKRDRRDRHLSAARYFEALGDDELAGVLASHYTDAYGASTPGPEADAVGAQARIALRAAADRSFALASPVQAATYLRRSLDVTPDPGEAARLYEDVGRAELLAGNWPPARRASREATDRYEALGDPSGYARAAGTLAECLLVDGDPDTAIGLCRRAMDGLAAAGVDAPELEIRIRGVMARGSMFLSRPADALAEVDAALPLAGRLDLVAEIADLLVTRAWAVSGLGREREADAILFGVITLTEQEGVHRVRFRAINNLIATSAEVMPRRSVELGRDAMAEAERLGDRDWADKLAGIVMTALITGDWDWAESVLRDRWRDDQPILTWAAPASMRIAIDAFRDEFERADSVLAELRHRVAQSRSAQDELAVHVASSYRLLAAGDLEGVRDTTRRMIDAARLATFEPREAALVLGTVCDLLDDPAGVREALGVVDSIAAKSEAATGIRQSLDGVLLARDGRLAEAGRVWSEALATFRHLGHELWAFYVDLAVIHHLDPGDPVAEDAGQDARHFAEAHGATALARLVDGQLGRAVQRTRTGVPQPTSSAGRTDHRAPGAPANVLTTS
jgi:class 3 adenylate cyclase